ncbi:peptidoglycan-recognition protein 2 [Anoplophora glabripennis]|nr:peptidoglycan-recognition protein 2 [Anoplophora glabripennis]
MCFKYCLPLFFCLGNVLGASPDWPKSCPDIVTRERWGARTAAAVDYALIPIKFAVIHHTVTPECSNEDSCSQILKSIQNFHMDTLEFQDIGYNFLVGGDGRIYEGASWHKVGAHTRGYNSRSLGLAFIGNFSDKLPNPTQLKAAKDFLQCAVELGELDRNYQMFGARQVSATESPGAKLFSELRKWPNFSRSP